MPETGDEVTEVIKNNERTHIEVSKCFLSFFFIFVLAR